MPDSGIFVERAFAVAFFWWVQAEPAVQPRGRSPQTAQRRRRAMTRMGNFVVHISLSKVREQSLKLNCSDPLAVADLSIVV
jgi:hypothetical protein